MQDEIDMEAGRDYERPIQGGDRITGSKGALAMVAAQQTEKWQRLSQSDGEKVLIATNDNDQFVIEFDDLIHACKTRDNLKLYVQQSMDLLGRLSAWLRPQAGAVAKAYIGFDSEGATFIVVRRDMRFDPDFELAMSDLEIELANAESFSEIDVRVLSLPYSSDSTVESFVKPLYAWTPNEQPE